MFADDPGSRNALIGPDVSLHVIRPVRDLPIDTLTCDPIIMTQLAEEGRQRAIAAMANPEDWLA